MAVMDKCLDVLTIQAIIDGEEKGAGPLKHLDSCAACRRQYQDLKSCVNLATCLSSPARLPASFFSDLTRKTSPSSFKSALAAALVFTVMILSAWLLNPGYLEWWLSVGLTRKVGLVMDAFLDLIYLSHFAGAGWVITGLVLLVTVEVMVLNLLRNVEGNKNA